MAGQAEKMYNKCFCPDAKSYHLLWKISDGFERKDVEGALFSFTAHEFKRLLKKSNSVHLEKYFVNNSDREYQFWDRNPMVKECWTKKFFQQKLNYIHFNPCQPHWNLAASPEDINGHQQDFMKQA